MASKLLKIELLLLSLLAVLGSFSFYYLEAFPDNFFSISSGEDTFSTPLYYLTSFVAYVGYYTGPWVLGVFAVFIFFYGVCFSRRDSMIDPLNLFSLAVCLLFGCYLFVPNFVGQGIKTLISLNISVPTAAVVLGISLVLFLAGSLRSSFADFCDSLRKYFILFPKWLYKMIRSIHPIDRVIGVKKKLEKMKVDFHLGFEKKLKGDDNIEEKPALQTRTEKQKKEKKSSSSLASKLLRRNEKSEIEEVNYREVKAPKSVPTAKKSDVSGNGEGDYLEAAQFGSHSSNHEKRVINDPDEGYFSEIISSIESKLSEFGVAGEIINILKGPVVDTFELALGSGVKVSKVSNLEKDISLALNGSPIRIVYPMPGRPTLGIEVPRNPRDIIYLDELLDTEEFQNTKCTLPIAMGKNAFGEIFITDLAAMPHMLVAGSTGAGKSVFINTMLVSLLVKLSPKEMKLILIDPKQLELALYADLPHLIMPVITDAKRASIALMWAAQEMDRRYSILKELGVRNVAGFNDKVKNATPEQLAKIKHFYTDDSEEYELPYLVIVVDEFADLMHTKAGKEIEINICRLAAKARASGIHMVLATQRPSVDVITGLIKSNFPTRVSFRVTSNNDSRTILDSAGAEKLLGKGDMLYRANVETLRAHSSYVDEVEVEELMGKLRVFGQEFNENAIEFLENDGEVLSDEYAYGTHIASTGNSSGEDELYEKAVQVVSEHRAASASMLQRRLKVGYNRAANLIDEMESRGVVGPAQGSKPRSVLVHINNS